MAIGDTVQAGLMRFDSSAYERAGQANAQANAAFGNALNQVARGFIEGQEKKARTEEMTGYLMNQGVSESDAKAIAKNPFLQKEYQRKKATEAQMQMEGNRLAMQARSIANQSRDASEKNLLARDEFDLKKQAQGRLFKKEDEQKRSEANLGRFLLTPRESPKYKGLIQKYGPEQIPGTPEFKEKELSEPMGARVPIMASYEMMKPDFERFQDAPGVARLPESFKPEGQAIVDQFAEGRINEKEGLQLLGGVEARAIAEAPEAMSPKDRLDLEMKLEDRERKRREDERAKFEEDRKDEEYEGEQKIKSFDGLKFEGLELQGSIQDATEAKKAKEGLLNFNAVMRDLDRLKELGELREEKTILKDDLKKEAAIISNRVRGQIRESILGPGTVNEAEREILVEQVPDPTEGIDFFSATYGEEGVALIEKLQNNLRKKVANNFANYGVTFKQSAGQASGRPTNSPPSESIRLGSGDEVEVIRLDR